MYLRGLVSGTAAAGAIITTLPAAFKPSTAAVFNRYPCVQAQSNYVTINLDEYGYLSDLTKTSGTVRAFICLNNVCFTVD